MNELCEISHGEGWEGGGEVTGHAEDTQRREGGRDGQGTQTGHAQGRKGETEGGTHIREGENWWYT